MKNIYVSGELEKAERCSTDRFKNGTYLNKHAPKDLQREATNISRYVLSRRLPYLDSCSVFSRVAKFRDMLNWARGGGAGSPKISVLSGLTSATVRGHYDPKLPRRSSKHACYTIRTIGERVASLRGGGFASYVRCIIARVYHIWRFRIILPPGCMENGFW